MSRPLRIEFPGALYHLTARRNERRPIARDDHDRAAFLEILGRTVERYSWSLYAYCLMRNHYHLVVETRRPELARGMRQLNGLYAKRFNRRHGRVGHLFQARYRSILIERETHLLEVVRYVVLNPVRARICELPEDYPWSSHRACAGVAPSPAFLASDELLALFGSGLRQATCAYQRFVLEALEAGIWRNLRGQIYLGDESFAKETAARARALADAENPRSQREPVPPSLAELFSAHGERAILIAYRQHGYRLSDLASYLGVHYSTASRRLRRQESSFGGDQMQDLAP